MSTPAVIISLIQSKSLKGNQSKLPHRVTKDNFDKNFGDKDFQEDVVVTPKRTFTKYDGETPMYGVIYHHWDGYPNTLGRHLKKFYKTQESVENLIAFGNMSTIVGGAEPYIRPHYINEDTNKGVTGDAWNNEDWGAKPRFSTNIKKLLEIHYHQFAYLFDGYHWVQVKVNKKGELVFTQIR